ncbi:Phosphoribosylformylglycinamidine cyclo-ligase [Thermobaculum terrenum ATCC BAA-798]|uniref:Phosphoribosylformylglycinamidine cyclo-ligase n=2 Tax=Thermobaculum TaxID=262406 RepID=D1CIF7_THET1|nr:Phosphoribosylformylglycinamidine cyclo-ligase [Thermobaculum terrenum ATCC BAA-798]
MDKQDRYASAGVDYDVLDRVKRLALAEAGRTGGLLSRLGMSEIPESRGETAYVVDAGDHYIATVLECLGTKSLVADAMRPHLGRSSYDRIAQDAVAAIVNDLVAVGATPLVVHAYFAVGASEWFADEERASDLVRGWARACLEAGASWGGGESPALGGIIRTDAIDLAGSAVGIVRPKSRLVTSDKLREGDAIVLLASTGIHTNGLSLARKLAAELPDGYLTPMEDGRYFGDALLDPAPLYSRVVEGAQQAGLEIHYMVHITGHGWRKLMRAPQDLTYLLEEVPTVPPVLEFICREGRIPEAEAYALFNMGAGFAIFLPPAQADELVRLASQQGVDALVAGRVIEGPRRVVIQPKGIEYSAEDLRIR